MVNMHDKFPNTTDRPNRPRRHGRCLILLPMLLGLPSLQAGEVGTLRESTEKWLELRTEIRTVKSDWAHDQALLEQEKKLLDQEKQRLQQMLEQLTAEIEVAKRARAADQQQAEALQTVLETQLLKPLEASERKLQQLQSVRPDFMAQRWAPAPIHSALTAPGAASGDTPETSWGDRLRQVLMQLGQLTEITNELHQEAIVLTRPDDERPWQFDALYLGLAQAYAVSPDNHLAAWGRPTRDGWRWTWHPELAPDIRKAIVVYRRTAAATTVSLPAEIVEEAE